MGVRNRSWACTVFTQVCLCVALYVAFNLGQPRKQQRDGVVIGSVLDSYFVTVRGGHRAPEEQTRLLKLMEKVSRAYRVQFVVSISELGKDDPLVQNGTQRFDSLRIPWYTTEASQAGKSYFREQIKMPHGKTLDLIGLDTGLFKDSVIVGSAKGLGEEQLQWLKRTLEEINSDWDIAVGFHPSTPCQGNNNQLEVKQELDPLNHLFSRYGLNAYISGRGCSHHVHQRGITYIGDPGILHNKSDSVSSGEASWVLPRELVDGFLLHRVSSLEMATYFVNLAGEAVYRTVLHQHDKKVI